MNIDRHLVIRHQNRWVAIPFTVLLCSIGIREAIADQTEMRWVLIVFVVLYPIVMWRLANGRIECSRSGITVYSALITSHIDWHEIDYFGFHSGSFSAKRGFVKLKNGKVKSLPVIHESTFALSSAKRVEKPLTDVFQLNDALEIARQR